MCWVLDNVCNSTKSTKLKLFLDIWKLFPQTILLINQYSGIPYNLWHKRAPSHFNEVHCNKCFEYKTLDIKVRIIAYKQDYYVFVSSCCCCRYISCCEGSQGFFVSKENCHKNHLKLFFEIVIKLLVARHVD